MPANERSKRTSAWTFWIWIYVPSAHTPLLPVRRSLFKGACKVYREMWHRPSYLDFLYVATASIWDVVSHDWFNIVVGVRKRFSRTVKFEKRRASATICLLTFVCGRRHFFDRAGMFCRKFDSSLMVDCGENYAPTTGKVIITIVYALDVGRQE